MRQSMVFMISSFIIAYSTVTLSQNLHPGDRIRLTIYNLPEAVSGEFMIQSDGRVQFPFIGWVDTRDQSPERVQAEIIDRYQSIYRDPEIAIQPLYKINVLGEVASPGVYYVSGVERLSDLLALAGGETEAANLNSLYLLRDNRKIDVNAKKILKEGHILEDLGLESGDRIYVPRKRWMSFRNASALISATALIITAARMIQE